MCWRAVKQKSNQNLSYLFQPHNNSQHPLYPIPTNPNPFSCSTYLPTHPRIPHNPMPQPLPCPTYALAYPDPSCTPTLTYSLVQKQWQDEWMNGKGMSWQTNRQSDRCMDGQTDRHTHTNINRQTDRQLFLMHQPYPTLPYNTLHYLILPYQILRTLHQNTNPVYRLTDGWTDRRTDIQTLFYYLMRILCCTLCLNSYRISSTGFYQIFK